MPKVSVIIPTYNRVELLTKAIDSVLSQVFDDYELLIIDDGSTDDTHNRVSEYLDKRIIYLHQPNRGLATARNYGLEHATGEFIAFLDDDDLFLPGKLDLQVEYLHNRPDIGLVASGYECIDGQGNVINEMHPWNWKPDLDLQTMLYGCPMIVCAVLVRRNWLELVGGFDISFSEQKIGSEDWDLWLRMSHAGCKMMWQPALVCAYRYHQENMVRNTQRQVQGMLLTVEKFFGQPDLPLAICIQEKKVLSYCHLRGAARQYAAGNLHDAQENVTRAIQFSPDLICANGDELFKAFEDWFMNPIVNNPIEYVKIIFDNLPETAVVLRPRKREACGKVFKRSFFEAYQRGDRRRAWKSLLEIIKFQPSLIIDRGILSLTLESVVGGKVMGRLRKLRIYSR